MKIKLINVWTETLTLESLTVTLAPRQSTVVEVDNAAKVFGEPAYVELVREGKLNWALVEEATP